MKLYDTKSRIIAFVLSLVLIFSFTSGATFASIIQADSKSLLVADLKDRILPDIDRPEVVSLEQVEKNKHVVRLKSEETDLNKVIFQNRDASQTMYCFSEPVKYIDKNGVIKDKNNSLYSAFDVPEYADKFAYVNSNNDINTFFPKILSEETGIVLDSAECKIEMIPSGGKSSLAEKNIRDSKEKHQSVLYSGVFGKDTAVRYTPTLQGFKEDIVLYQNIGNEFDFIIKANGLKALNNGDKIDFVNSSGEVVANIDTIYVYDSFAGDAKDGETHNTRNNNIIIEMLNNGDYQVTIVVDVEFLRSPDTVYPVYVDPTVTVNTSGSGTSKTIIDCPIYNGSGAKGLASGSNTYNLVGYVGTSGGVVYGTGRTLMKFPGLINNSTFSSLPVSAISNVSLYIPEVSGLSTAASIGAYYYTGSAWSESTANYNNTTWYGYGSHISSTSIGSTSQVMACFNLTSAVSTWKGSSATADKGIMLKNNSSETSSSYRKDFYSTESSASKPYITFTYTYYGCKPYVSDTSSSVNCQGYAFFKNNWPSGWFTSSDYNYCIQSSTTTTMMLDRTKTRMVTWLNSNFYGKWQEVSGPSVTLNSNQWLVCMRVGKNYDPYNEMSYDYHYWYRTNTGVWANKHGQGNSVLLPSSDTPYTNSSSGWELWGYWPFYNSATVYYCVTQ